jgi:hypothetical protein
MKASAGTAATDSKKEDGYHHDIRLLYRITEYKQEMIFLCAGLCFRSKINFVLL